MYSAAKVLLFCETNKYFARKMKISLTFFYFYRIFVPKYRKKAKQLWQTLRFIHLPQSCTMSRL